MLRVTTGFLLIWSGFSKIVKAKPPLAIGRNFELDATTNAVLGYSTGGAQLVISVLCALGLWRRFALPLQAAIHGFTAASVWWAIIDPYRWYITGVDRIVFNSQVFYPTIITFAACILLIVDRHQDTLALDHLRREKPVRKPEVQSATLRHQRFRTRPACRGPPPRCDCRICRPRKAARPLQRSDHAGRSGPARWSARTWQTDPKHDPVRKSARCRDPKNQRDDKHRSSPTADLEQPILPRPCGR